MQVLNFKDEINKTLNEFCKSGNPVAKETEMARDLQAKFA